MFEETMGPQNNRNIMILFLSNLHGKWNKEKTELRWNSTENEYSICQSSKTVWCRETNEAPLKEILTTIGKPLDAIFYFSTKQVGMYPPQKGVPLKKRISISFPPNYTSSKRYDSEAHFFWTVRAKEVAGDLLTESTRIVPVPFDDDGKGNFVEDAISAVRLMESAIKQYLADEKVPLDHCYLYADITGGKRTANMAMSAVIQLLQYEGVHLRRVVYSDFDPNRKGENDALPIHPVGNVQPIHDMHRLVAGVDAFEKYGSSAALNDFFKDEIKQGQEYAPLANLLSAMNKFSEAVLLCQPDSIEAHLQTLMEALEKFPMRAKEPRPAKVELLARMLPELKLKYLALLQAPMPDGKRKADRLPIIRWCVKNTLLQQALTFCTEWLPEYMIEHGILYTDDVKIQEYCSSQEFFSYRSSKKNFLMGFCTKSLMAKCKSDKSKTGLKMIAEQPEHREVPPELYDMIVEAAAKNDITFPEEEDPPAVASYRWQSLEKDFQPVADFLQYLPQELHILKSRQKSKNVNRSPRSAQTAQVYALMAGIYRMNVDKMLNTNNLPKLLQDAFTTLHNWGIKDYELFFRTTLVKERPILPQYSYSKSIETACLKQEQSTFEKMGDTSAFAAAYASAMLKCGIMKTMCNKKDAIDYIREYTYIRDELRNKMDHASEAKKQETNEEPHVKITIEGITNHLEKYLALLEKVKAQHHTCVGLWANTQGKKIIKP